MRSCRLAAVKSAKAIKIITWISVGIVAFSAIAWLGLGRISGAISRVNVFDNLKNRPERASSAVNYLVVGSDTREGLTPAELKLLRVGRMLNRRPIIDLHPQFHLAWDHH